MDKPRHPPLLKVLFFTEMWERFNFYLMLGILFQYLTNTDKNGLGLSKPEATVIYGTYIALVYFTPFIGGLLADRLLGCRVLIMIGGALMMLGSFTLAIPGKTAMYVGLLLLILGNGAFKPNISTMVGNLYPPGSPLKDAGFNIFYMGINIGAFFCNFVAAIVRNVFDVNSEWGIVGWNAAFATDGIGMFIGLLTFLTGYRALAQADPDPRQSDRPRESLQPLWVQCLGPAVLMGALFWAIAVALGADHESAINPPIAAFLGACIPAILFFVNIWRKQPNPVDRGRVAALLVIFGVSIVFWMTFHLNGSVLTLWADENTNREPNAVMQVFTDVVPGFSENAPPKYYFNAGPDVPRPDGTLIRVVSDEEYKKRKEEKKLTEKIGGKDVFFVTQKDFDKVYARAPSEASRQGQHLQLVNTELFQSINAGCVVLFTPLVVGFWHFLRLRGKEPSSAGKIGLGILLLAGGPLFMIGATAAADGALDKVTAWWLFGTYAIFTFAELCLSPMGLSVVSKVSPTNMKALMMGGWFLSTSIGNKLSGIFGEAYVKMDNKYAFWTILIVCNLAFAGAVFALLPWLKRQMATETGVAEAQREEAETS